MSLSSAALPLPNGGLVSPPRSPRAAVRAPERVVAEPARTPVAAPVAAPVFEPAADPVLAERALVLAAQAGDARAFAGLVRLHQRRAYAVARAIVLTHEDAEDATQEGFLHAYRALERLGRIAHRARRRDRLGQLVRVAHLAAARDVECRVGDDAVQPGAERLLGPEPV